MISFEHELFLAIETRYLVVQSLNDSNFIVSDKCCVVLPNGLVAPVYPEIDIQQYKLSLIYSMTSIWKAEARLVKKVTRNNSTRYNIKNYNL